MIMKQFKTTDRTPGVRFLFMIAMKFALVFSTACSEAAAPALEGLHVHRSGSSPYFLHSAKVSLKAYEGQCKLMKSVCAMMPAGASSKDRAACVNVGSGFQLKGNLANVGSQETDEYFATSLSLSARQIRKTVLQVNSICEVQVVEQESVDIRHYTSKGYTQYELKNHPKKGRYWLRTEHEHIDSKTGALLKGSFNLSSHSSVSQSFGQKSYAGFKCELREVTGPWAGSLCLMATDTIFPGHVTLAGTIVAGKDTLLDEKATAVTVKIMLPRTHFYPSEGDRVEAAEGRSVASGNATQRWCQKQKLKTGVNPCEGDSGEDGK